MLPDQDVRILFPTDPLDCPRVKGVTIAHPGRTAGSQSRYDMPQAVKRWGGMSGTRPKARQGQCLRKALRGLAGQTAYCTLQTRCAIFAVGCGALFPAVMPKWNSGPLPRPQEASCAEAGPPRRLGEVGGLSSHPEDQPKMNRRAASTVSGNGNSASPPQNSAVSTTVSTSHMTSFTFHLQLICCIAISPGIITKNDGIRMDALARVLFPRTHLE